MASVWDRFVPPKEEDEEKPQGSVWDQFSARGPYSFDMPAPPPEQGPSFARQVGDVGVQFLAGIPYAGRSLAGLAGLVPGVNLVADPLAEGLGKAGQYIEENLLSDYALGKRDELARRQAQEEGFVDQAGATLKFLAENPSMVPGAVAQSIPSLFGGGVVGAGIRRGAQGLGLTRTAMSPLATGVAGESAMIAGSVAADIAEQNPEEFAARYYALPAGAAGGAVSLASGRLLGRSDIDTMIAQRLMRNQLGADEAVDMLTFTPGMAGRIGRGALGEGLLEEAPQSAFEQIATNLGTNQDPFANLGGQVAMGGVVGAAMGAGAGVGRPRGTYTRQELAQAQTIAADETADPNTRLEAFDFIRRVELGQLGPEEAQARYAARTTTPFEQPAFTPYEPPPYSEWQSPRDILTGQGLSQVETGGLVAPGIRQTAQGIYMMEPEQGGVTGGLGPLQQQFLQGPPTGRARLRETQPRPVSGELGPQQQAALAGGQPRPVAQPLGPRQQAALTGGQPASLRASTAAPLPAAQPAAGLSIPAAPAAPTPAKPTRKVSKGVIESAAKVDPLSAAEVDEVGKILGDLEAKVATEPGKAQGRVTLPQGVLAGVMRTIRSLKNLTPVVYQPKTANVDVEQTQQYSEQMNAIRDAAKNVVARAEALFNAQSNVVPSDSKAAIKAPKGMTADDVAAAKAQEVANKLVPLQQELRNAIDNLRTAAGNDRNVEALVAVLKARAQKQTQKPLPQAKQDTKVDTLLSQAWAMYKDGALDSAEALDIVRGRETRVSREVEAKGATEQPLVTAATEGYARRVLRQKRTETPEQFEQRVEASKEKGVLGMLAYIQRHGSGFERLIASSVARALRNPSATAPKYEWIPANETPRYDPKTNTVYIHRTASPEQTLHETLHAALQWYVYQNQDSAEVLRLDRALQKVLDYKGEMSPKAKEVIDTLRKVAKGRSKTARLDAILELVSYGTTLNEFRQLLKSMETAETPEQRGLLSGLTDLWKRVTALVQKFLGVSNTVANDVLDATVALLEQAATTEQVGKRTGNVLQAAVATDLNTTNDQVAKDAGYPNFKSYASTPGGSFNPTRQFFEALGFGKAGYRTKQIRDLGTKAAEKIRKDFPTLERYILAVNSKFSNPPGLEQIIDFFKSKQNTGILEMEKITEFLQRSPKDAEAVLNYLDGDTKALDGIKHKEALKSIADNVLRHLNIYINDLPQGSKERKLFESLKFTEYLLNPDSVAQLAGKAFGMKKLSTLLGLQRRSEANIEAFKDLLPKTAAGDVDLEAPLYQVFETKPDAEGKLTRMPWGFISKAMADKNPPAGLDIDFGRVWRTEKFSDEGYSFISRTTTPQQVREMAKKQDIDKLSAALLNTMSALSHNYASRYYFNGLSGFGREGNTAEGKATAQTVAFKNVDEINEVFGESTGRIIDKDNVLKVSDEASKMKDIRKTTQRTGTWVQLPDTATYGELAGKIIPGPVWNSMLDMHDRNPLFNWQALNDTMTFFKKAKTVYTPATHVNNILTNYSLMLLHGIPHSALKDAANLFIRFETNPKSLSKDQLAMMQAFYASGAVLGQFTTTEAKQTIAKALADNLSPDSKSSFLTTLADFAKVEKGIVQKAKTFGKNADTFMTNAYAAGDNIFRLAAFMNTAGNIQLRDKSTGLSQEQLEEAGIAARKMFLDYDIDARAVRAARQSFMPFISWSYAIMPVLGRIAIEKPWAMVNMMAALAVMSAVMGGEDDDEIRREGPESLRQKFFGVPHYIRIPFMGDAENPVYYNIGKSIPMMALFQPSPQEVKFAGQEWIPGFLTPSGPYASLIAGTFFGLDPFTGKNISQPTDTQWDKLVNTGQSVYNTMAPSFAQTRFAEQAKALAEGRVGPTGNETNALFLARTLGGMSLYQFNRDESRFYQNNELKKIKRDFSTAMNRAKREELRKGYPDYEALDKDLESLRKRMDKTIADLLGDDATAADL